MKTSSIIICDNCRGTGIISRDKLTNYYKREYDTHHDKCWKCDGSGRLWQVTTVEYAPYKPTPELIGTIT